MTENWLNTPQAVDLYNFIKQKISYIIPVHDYAFEREYIEQRILELRRKEGKTDDNRGNLESAIKQLDAEGIILAYDNGVESTLERHTGENYL